MVKLAMFLFILWPLSGDSQIISLFAGGGTLLGDGGPATACHISDAVKGAFDMIGNYYVVDLDGNRIRKIDTSGIITSIAGTGTRGDSGDGMQATGAELNIPASLTIDSIGDIYICESGGNRVRKIDQRTGIIATVAGNGIASSTGDGGGLASAATLDDPQDICFDRRGNLYISEYFSNKVRKINPSGIISTYAGTGISGYSGDGGRADTSKIGGIEGLCTDTAGNLYLADNGNSRVFKINTLGIITTYAGTATGYLYNGDEIASTIANIDPYKIVMDYSGNLFIAEYHNFRVRKVDVAGLIHTVAGNGTATSSGDGGQATAASMYFPNGVALDACGNLYIPETANGHVRKINFNPSCNRATANVVNVNSTFAAVCIYPNPISNFIQVNNINSRTTYYLYNTVGGTAQRGTLKEGNNTLPMQNLATGVYILELVGEDGERVVRKVVKE